MINFCVLLQRQKCCHSAAFFKHASDTENHAEIVRDTDKQKNDIKADVIAHREVIEVIGEGAEDIEDQSSSFDVAEMT